MQGVLLERIFLPDRLGKSPLPTIADIRCALTYSANPFVHSSSLIHEAGEKGKKRW